MAYSDIQEKLGQQMMANSVLLAEKYSQGNLFPKGSEGNPYSKNPRAQSAKRKRDYKKAQEEKKSAKQVSDEARQREFQRRKERGEVFGDMPPDFNLMENLDPNSLLQIGGKALDLLKFVPQMMIRGNRIAGRPGYHTTTNGGFVNQAGKVFYNDNGVLRPDGDYDEKIHGALIPPIGLDQAMNNTNNSMKIYG